MTFKSILLASALAACAPFPLSSAFAQTAESAAVAKSQSQATQRPNVLVWMLDDVGFAQIGSYGGLVETPNIDRVARLGLRYTNYHTTPICSASRAAFLTGRNSHSVHVGGHSAGARPYPGYDSEIPAEDGTIAAYLKRDGYATFALGKWDHLPSAQQSGPGPFRLWPTGQGFDRFYGFLAADTSNWEPTLVTDNTPIPTPRSPSYHLSADMADKAIEMIAARRSAAKPAPFFMYWATGAAHAPHHAPPEWITRFKGKFDDGWDRARQRILDRQIAQGLVPKATKLAPRPDGMPAWTSLSRDQRRLYARQMEAFAAALSYADHEFGRILDSLEASGELDDTIVVITSDNGASAEGAVDGSFNEMLFVNGVFPDISANLKHYETWGDPSTYPHYAVGWAVAGNTPFRYYKQTTYEGGIRVPLIVAWPNGIRARNETRRQFVHVSDIAPTILGATGVKPAEFANDVRQTPLEGQDISRTFASQSPPNQRPAQYFEMYGNKALILDDWAIVTNHRTSTWDMTASREPNEPWELYDLRADPGQTRNVAAQNPERVALLAEQFDAAAKRYNVYPIGSLADARRYAGQRAQAEFAARNGVWTFDKPVSRLADASAPPLLHRSFRMSASLSGIAPNATGPIFASGGRLGGMSLFLRSGVPVLQIRDFAGGSQEVVADARLVGDARIEVDFKRDAAPPMTPIDISVALRINGNSVGGGVLRAALPATFSISDSFDIGCDDGSAVAPETATPFSGAIRDVTFDFR